MYEDGSLYIPHERLNITDKNTYKVNLLLAMGSFSGLMRQCFYMLCVL